MKDAFSVGFAIKPTFGVFFHNFNDRLYQHDLKNS